MLKVVEETAFSLEKKTSLCLFGEQRKPDILYLLSIMGKHIIANVLFITLSAWQMVKWQNIWKCLS